MSQLQQLPTIPIRVELVPPRGGYIGGGFEWYMEETPNGDYAYYSKNRIKGFKSETIPAEVARNKFLALKTPQDVLQFFQQTNFHYHHILSFDEPLKTSKNIPAYKKVSELRRLMGRRALFSEISILQDYIRSLSVLDFSEWKPLNIAGNPTFTENISIEIDIQSIPPFACCKSWGLDAIIALIKIEKIQGMQYRYCSRKGCRDIFKIESRHKRKFCSPECAHLAAVWRSRGIEAEYKTSTPNKSIRSTKRKKRS